MDDDASQKPHATRWIIGSVLALGLYVLSWGPVWAWTVSGKPMHGQPEWIQKLYGQVTFFYGHSLFLDALNKWTFWWLDQFGGMHLEN